MATIEKVIKVLVFLGDTVTSRVYAEQILREKFNGAGVVPCKTIEELFFMFEEQKEKFNGLILDTTYLAESLHSKMTMARLYELVNNFGRKNTKIISRTRVHRNHLVKEREDRIIERLKSLIQSC